MWIGKLHWGAEDDILDAVEWYSEHDPKLAKKFVASIQETLASILSDPERIETIGSGIRGAPVRKFPYRVIFRIEDELVQVVAVSHHSRRQGYWNKRLDS
jgi:toxin ParE1/3/4